MSLCGHPTSANVSVMMRLMSLLACCTIFSPTYLSRNVVCNGEDKERCKERINIIAMVWTKVLMVKGVICKICPEFGRIGSCIASK